MVADTFIGLITNQISTWLGDNPTVSIGLGITGLALVDYITGGKIYNSALKAYDFLKDYLQQAYQIVTHFAGYLTGYVSFITSNFEVDNPRKTFYLSLIFLVLVYALIFLFSGQSWGDGGITEIEKKDFSLGDFRGVGTIGSDTKIGNLPDITTTTLNPDEPPPEPPPTDLNYTWINSCYTDNDCVRRYEGASTKCCFPDIYAGYFCQGQCLLPSFTDLERDACYHPASCLNVNNYAQNIIMKDATACINKGQNEQDNYCHLTGDYTSKCCNDDKYQICYGYCTRANTSDNCQNIDHCYKEFEIIVTPTITLPE